MSKESIPQPTSSKSNHAREETVTINILIPSGNSEGKLKKPIATNSEHGTKITKWNQFSQFSETSTTVIPTAKT